MKVAVVGSRSFDSYEYLKTILGFYDITLLISGGAKGADLLAKRYAAENNIQYREYLPDWSLGKKAGFLRNQQIVNDCQILIAFWDQQSPGTKISIKLAKEAGKEVFVYWPDADFFLSNIGN